MSLVLQDCLSVMEHYPETSREKVMEIAGRVILDHRLLRERVSHREVKKHRDNPGKYLSGVVEEMCTLSENSLDRLASLVKTENVQ